MSENEHACNYYCQDGLHAYVCLSPRKDTASEVLAAAQTWLDYLGWPDAVVRVQPAREMDVEQVLQEHMIGIDHRTYQATDVRIVCVDVAVYRPWVVLLRPHAAPPPDDGEEEE